MNHPPLGTWTVSVVHKLQQKLSKMDYNIIILLGVTTWRERDAICFCSTQWQPYKVSDESYAAYMVEGIYLTGSICGGQWRRLLSSIVSESFCVNITSGLRTVQEP